MIARDFVEPGLGGLRLSEVTVAAVARFLLPVKTNHDAATPKGCRSVLWGMCALAMRRGAMTANPTRDTRPISATKEVVRALTVEEQKLLVKKVSADAEAKRLDLVDLVVFMLWLRGFRPTPFVGETRYHLGMIRAGDVGLRRHHFSRPMGGQVFRCLVA